VRSGGDIGFSLVDNSIRDVRIHPANGKRTKTNAPGRVEEGLTMQADTKNERAYDCPKKMCFHGISPVVFKTIFGLFQQDSVQFVWPFLLIDD
jgi:hypothetical protein